MIEFCIERGFLNFGLFRLGFFVFAFIGVYGLSCRDFGIGWIGGID